MACAFEGVRLIFFDALASIGTLIPSIYVLIIGVGGSYVNLIGIGISESYRFDGSRPRE